MIAQFLKTDYSNFAYKKADFVRFYHLF